MQEEVTRFIDEGVIPSSDAVPNIVDISTDFKDMSLRESREHDIKGFLKRPILIHSGEWSSVTSPATQIYTANFPETLISNSMYQEKLKGFVGLRATLVVRVQVNTQPFQQGRLMLQYIPYAQYLGDARVNMINNSLQGRSGCPRTDLDVSVGTEITMRIPYVSPHLYYNLITGQGSFGSIYLIVYSQLQDEVSGSGNVEYSIWAHLEDVEVEFPTGASIYTGNAPNILKTAQRILREPNMRVTELDLQPPERIYAQIFSELMDMKQSGLISNSFGTLSDGLNTLSDLPVIGKFLQAPSWISSQISNIAQLFGFSKPTSQAVPCDTKLRGQTRMANYNGVDMSHKMALSANNELETRPGLAGTSTDEMALSAFTSIPNYWTRFNWSVDQLTGTTLYQDLVSPIRIQTTATDGVYNTTHMGYVANVHTYWRGSIVYTFKFVKTNFHTGRLQILFAPFWYGGDSRPIGGFCDLNKCYRAIVDLRESTEVSFTVPYVSSRPWMFTTRPDAPWLTNGTVSDFYNYNCATGMIRVDVLNKLVAGHNVYQSIDCIVEVSGGPDLTFAGPTCPDLLPYNASTTERIMAQMMGDNEAVQRNDAQLGKMPDSIANGSISQNWSPEALCIGEKIVSIRQLIKRFSPIADVQVGAEEIQRIVISPFSVPEPASTTAYVPMPYYSMLQYFYYLFGFYRGGMRLKAYFREPAIDTIPNPRRKLNQFIDSVLLTSADDQMNDVIGELATITGPSNSVVQALNITDEPLYAGASWQTVDTSLEGLVELEVPYYNISHITPTSMALVGEKPIQMDLIYRGLIPPSLLIMDADLTGLDALYNVKVFRAVADDFSFLYTLGVPQLYCNEPTPPPPPESILGAGSIYLPD